MAKNDFKSFATAANANVTPQVDWEALPALLSGFTAGKASSAQVNKALRQATFIAAALAQYTANTSGQDVLDDGDLAGFIEKMTTAFRKDFPTIESLELGALATKDSLGPADVNALARDQNLADLPDLSQALSNLTVASVKTAVESTSLGAYKLNIWRITEDAELDMLPAGYMGLCKNQTQGGPLPGYKWYYLHVTGKLDNPADNPARRGGVIKLTAFMDHDFETWTGIKFDDGSGNVEKYRWTRHSTYDEATRSASTSQAGRVQLNDSISSTSTMQAATPNAVRLAYNEATRAASTSQSGRVQLNDSVSSTSTTQAATASAVRRAYDKAVIAYNQSTGAPPVGSPIPWPRSTAPNGWLKCAGQSFSKSSYPELARAYPDGRLPDLRGEFIRGYDDGRGVDSRRQILSSQGDAIRNIEGRIGADDQTAGYLSGAFFRYGDYDYDAKSNGGYGYIAGFDASRVVPTANENRPRNIAFLYIVRAI